MSVGEAAIHKSRIKLKPDNRSRNYTDEFYFVQINAFNKASPLCLSRFRTGIPTAVCLTLGTRIEK